MSHSDAMTKTNKRFRKFPSKHHLCCRRAAYIKIKFPVSFTICLLAAAWNFFEFQTEKGHRLAKSGDTAEDSNGTRWLGGSVFQYHSTRESWRATPPPLSCKSRIMFDQKMSQMKLSINSAVVGWAEWWQNVQQSAFIFGNILVCLFPDFSVTADSAFYWSSSLGQPKACILHCGWIDRMNSLCNFCRPFAQFYIAITVLNKWLLHSYIHCNGNGFFLFHIKIINRSDNMQWHTDHALYQSLESKFCFQLVFRVRLTAHLCFFNCFLSNG